MYLKSIEVQGFKSFANKIFFKFHNGITGIVGPNGSGKSNVADAVRWVLGEQRIKQLRGATMQDVIFSGTELRRPLSYAYVAITLDNSDHQLPISYDEVTVARRLYRSGESEYSINGTIVRLKDVNELFYDTGIGKEGYSIIGQGQIERILSGKPEERRELFDEAAGIVKFKRRKSQAQKKLEDEQSNLIRVRDILEELEKQVGPLERQSEKAREYLKRRDELKRYDVNLFLVENRQVRQDLQSAGDSLDVANSELEEVSLSYGKAKDVYENMDQEVERLDKAIETAKSSVGASGLERSRLEGEIGILKERIKFSGEHIDHLNSRRDAINAQIEGKKSSIDAINEDKEKSDKQLFDAESGREKAQGELEKILSEIADINEKIDAAKTAILDELNDRSDIKTRIQHYDTIMEQDSLRRSELASKMITAKSEEAGYVESIKELETVFAEVTEKVKSLNEEKETSEKRINDIKGELTSKDESLRASEARFHAERSKFESLRNIAERYDGYGNAIKRVMEQKDREDGLIGVVADIITVDKKYETAIETALGGSIQNIVTKDEGTAKRMIDFLKKKREGRATFLPLDSLESNDNFEGKKVLSEKGVLGTADSLIKIKGKYKKVASHLLGRVLVVDTADNALRLASKHHHRFRMVTLEGELLTPGGAISGGAYKNNSNLLGRRRELEELSASIEELESNISDINKSIEDIKSERNGLRTAVISLQTDIQNAILEQNTARINLEQARARQSESLNGYDSMKEERESIEKRLETSKAERSEALAKLDESNSREVDLNKQVEELGERLLSMRKEEVKAQGKVSDWDLVSEKLRAQQSFKQQDLDRVLGEARELDNELLEIRDNLEKNRQDNEARQESIVEIEARIKASLKEEEAAEKKIADHLQKRSEYAEERKKSLTLRDELSDRKNALSGEVQRLISLKEKLESQIDSKISYMWEEYEITLSAAAELRDETLTDMALMRKEIGELKGQIKALGDVNVNAIEEYRELMERYTLMKTQYDDLIESEETIRGIIEELDTAMRKQFAEKFSEINTAFDRVFKEMFGGGKGTLELMEDEDILEAGIRIVAQPPGKKLQNMMQLSGGEKALTAIALLFAIQDLKPSPFCLLDEIEAALDESNVSRFAKYLSKLTDHTQFIVITHRRGTMERADRLYGITMQEKGISTLVSVSLVESELLAQEDERAGA